MDIISSLQNSGYPGGGHHKLMQEAADEIIRLRQQVQEVLQTCEMALYAGQDRKEIARHVLQQAGQVIRELARL